MMQIPRRFLHVMRCLCFSVSVVALFGLAGCAESVDPKESTRRGKALFDGGDVAAAIIEYKNALQAEPENGETRLLLGQAYITAGNPEGALKEFRRARSYGVTSDELNQGMVRAHIGTGDFEMAATELALSSVDDSAEWLLLQGRLDSAVGRLEEARKAFDAAIELDPNNTIARTYSIRTAIALGEVETARQSLNEALKIDSDDFDVWLLKGDIDVYDKKFDSAIEAYSEALRITPGSPLALLQRSRARAETSDYDGALADLDAIGKASEEDPRALYIRASIARSQGNENAALRYLRQILIVAPTHGPTLMKAATIHYDSGEYNQAKEYLERLLAIDPSNEKFRTMLSSAQLASGELETGLGDMKNADIESFSDPSLLALLGTAYLKHGNLVEGRDALQRASELAPDSIPIRTQLAFAKMRAGNSAEALQELEVIRAEDPDFLLASVFSAFGLAISGERDKALALTDDLIENDPENPIMFNLRGYLNGAFDRDAAAKADFIRALEIDPTFAPANFNLARLATKSNDVDEARRQLQSVLGNEPNHPQALLHLGILQANEGEHEAAVALWQQAREHNPEAVGPRILLSRHKRQKESDLQAAAVLAEEAYDLAPFQPEAQFEYVLAKLGQRDAQTALPVIESLIERLPEQSQPLELRARAYEQLGNFELLRSTLDEIVEKFPQRTAARTALARLHISRGEFAEAMKIKTDIAKNPDVAVLANDLEGDIKFAEGDYAAAAAAFKKAHDANPNSQSVLKLHAALRRMGGDIPKTLDTWLDQHPDDHGVRIVRATDMAARGDRKAAISDYEDVLKRLPENIIVLNNLAYLYDELGDARALEFAKRAYDLAPRRPEIADTYGWILVRSGSQQQGLALLNQALEIDPENRDIRYHLASALKETGDSEKAVEQLNSILGDDRPFQLRNDAEALLSELTK